MLYHELCDHYARMESTSKRLEMTDILTELLFKIDIEDAEIMIRLTKGEVRPGYEGIELGVAEKIVLKSLYAVTMIPENEIRSIRINKGDIGDTAEELVKRKRQQSLFNEPLELKRVYNNLLKIASSEGRSSQDLKTKLIAELLHDASPIEAKYLTRTLCQKMRIGIADMTMIDSISYFIEAEMHDIARTIDSLDIDQMDKGSIGSLAVHSIIGLNDILSSLPRLSKSDVDREVVSDLKERITAIKERTKKNRERIVKAYNIHPDLAHITKVALSKGMDGIEEIRIVPGIPLRSMLGERLRGIEDILEKMGGTAAFEYKYDGLRAQVHRDEEGRIMLFSRQLENITDQFPDVVKKLKDSMSDIPVIIEGECVPIDPGTGELLPFQVISRRRGRKHDLEDTMEEVPVDLVLFDCLFLDGEPFIDRDYLERREAIRGILPGIEERIVPDRGVSLSRMELIRDTGQGTAFFEAALDNGSEGIMAKSVSDGSIYQAGSRGWNWIKFKQDYGSRINDTMDLVIIGGFHGSGRRGGTYGAFLMAVYDDEEDVFRTICKLGSGFTDEDLISLRERLEDCRVDSDEVRRKIDTRIEPDIHFKPVIVLETQGAEISYSPVHTCGWDVMKKDHGLAVRFPRFTGRYRNDKGPVEATTVKEIISLYSGQKRTI